MIKLEDINKSISFDEPSHIYRDKNGKILTSTTTVLGFFKNKFDPDGHIVRAVAKRDGLSTAEVLKNWENTKNKGLERGKNFHRQAEYFIKTGTILDEDYKDVIAQLKDIPFKGELFSEIGLHSEKYSIAGTCDLISLFDKNSTLTFDFKSNKQFTTLSQYNKFLLYPIQHLPETDLIIYSLQLCIYNLMLSEHGYKVKKGSIILWVNPDTRKIEKFNVLDLSKEAKDLLEHFKKIQKF